MSLKKNENTDPISLDDPIVGSLRAFVVAHSDTPSQQAAFLPWHIWRRRAFVLPESTAGLFVVEAHHEK